MTINVYDYRRDIANVIVQPEIRARFLRMEPGGRDPGRVHSHDLGGEIFLVLEGQCEFIVENERVTCGPGQLIYVEPHLKHTLRAVGDAPCTVYLSVTPHVEPTHTQYSEALERQAPRYGTWRGQTHGDPYPGATTAELARRYAAEARRLSNLARVHADAMEGHAETLSRTDGASGTGRAVGSGAEQSGGAKQVMDDAWQSLRDVLWQVRQAELSWNALAPRGTPAPPNRAK